MAGISSLSTLFLLSASAALLLMFGTWIFSMRMQNAGFVDAAWAYGFSLLAALGAYLGSGYGPRRVLILAMVAGWSLRLGTHLLLRVMGHHPAEDGRYRTLREKWKSNLGFKFLVFFELQGLMVAGLSVPFMLICLNPSPGIRWVEFSGLALWVLALAGESAADAQLNAFKLNPANKEKVCRTGLWNLSRHPNYFFEWMIWIAYAVFALGSPRGWTGILCAIFMFYFLYFVTGIPATEAQAVRSKGEEYIRYQRATSPFIPWFPKRLS